MTFFCYIVGEGKVCPPDGESDQGKQRFAEQTGADEGGTRRRQVTGAGARQTAGQSGAGGFGHKLGQNCPKWDKSGTQTCPIKGLNDTLSAHIRNPWSGLLKTVVQPLVG